MTIREAKAVLDRIEDQQHAVLLVGEQQHERVVPANTLPAGTKPGDWLRVRFEGDAVLAISVDLQETEQTQQRIADKLARLRQRGRRPQG